MAYAYPSQPYGLVAPPPVQVVAASPPQIITIAHSSRPLFGSGRHHHHHQEPTIVEHHHYNVGHSRRRGRSRHRHSSRKKRINESLRIEQHYGVLKAGERMDNMQATGTPLEMFTHAINNTDDVKLDQFALHLQKLLVNARYMHEQVFLSIDEESTNKHIENAASFSVQTTERTLDINFRDYPDDAEIALLGSFRFTFSSKDVGESSYTVHFTEQDHDISSVRVNLYDDIHSQYGEYQLPVVYATLYVHYNDDTDLFTLKNIIVSVDFMPDSPTFVTQTPRIDVLPILYNVPLEVAPASTEDRRFRDRMHARFSERLGSIYHKKDDRETRWQLYTNVLTSGHVEDGEHRVIWGKIVDSIFAYIVVEGLLADNIFDAIDSSEFLVRTISVTENGRALVDLVSRLYAALHESEPLVEQVTFPTLRQVLMHTTGLPSNTFVKYETIVDYYETIIAKLQASEREFDMGPHPQESADTQVADVIAQLQKYERADVDPGTIVGNYQNVFDALILFLYIQTITRDPPLQAVWRKLRERFGVDAYPTTPADPDFADPVALTLGVSTTFSHLKRFVERVASEFGDATSVSSHLLLNPVYVNPEAKVAHALGWSIYRTVKGTDIIFLASGRTGVYDNTVIFYVPTIDYWGVVNEYVRDFNGHLAMTSEVVITTLADSIDSFVLGVTLTSDDQEWIRGKSQWYPHQAIEHLPNSVYSRRREDVPLGREHAERIAGRDYVDPFINLTSGTAQRISVSLINDDGRARLQIIGGGARQHVILLAYTGEGDVFFKKSEPYANGNNIIVTPEFVCLRGQFFLAVEKTEQLLRNYKSALSVAQKTISVDIHSQSHISALRAVRAHDLTAEKYFENPVGWGRGGFRRARWAGGFRRGYPYRGIGPGFGLGYLAASALYPPYYAGYYDPYYGY